LGKQWETLVPFRGQIVGQATDMLRTPGLAVKVS
jgi:hypothetical protein